MEWFNQGYAKVEERAKEIDEAMNRTYIPDFILKEDEDDCSVRFITGQPITFYEHYLPSKKRSFTCPDSGDPSRGNCPLCATGNKASFRGAYMLSDHRYEEWKDKEQKTQSRQNTLKVGKFGVRVLKTLGKLEEKLKKKGLANGILDVDFEVMRTGSGTDTAYQFTPLTERNAFPTPPVPEKDAKEGKDYRALMIEAIKPKSREELLKVISGVDTPAAASGGSGTGRKPLDLGDDNDDVIKFT